ncbi:MAG: alkaline phosphatase family protein [Nanoarchaeota archaeon]
MKTLILFVDALRMDYITKQNTPFIYSLKQKYNACHLKQPFGYTSIGASFFTGLNPNKHKQLTLYTYSKKRSLFKRLFRSRACFYLYNLLNYYLGNDFFIPKIKNFYQFTPTIKKYYHHENSLPYKTLLNIFNEKGINYLVYNWPLVVHNNKTKLEIVRHNDASITKAFLKLCKKDYNFYMLHLLDLDKYAHKYGPNSKEIKKILKHEDEYVKKIVKNFDLSKDLIIIWSDHGMLEVKENVNLEKALPKSKDYAYFLDSTLARFWFFNNEIKNKIIAILKKQKGRILNKNDFNKYKIPKGYGDLIFLIDKYKAITPDFFNKAPVKGMHGYNLTDKNEFGILIINKKIKKQPYVIDLFPTILKIIKIKCPKVDGVSLV